ncbi:glutathione ABC transporter permease GsiC [Solemya pervernicosa gill symbiont]|uniref:Glutathione ABC transporter permease GsiC n=1 Tax=Solemya pervernicosa gill symbiont TaxID=642797 RepID=A0A1T2LAK1_9GAMM|nr:glutathione ABC transporter permease GsiC [Solemya pervernicosa gill symbiont]
MNLLLSRLGASLLVILGVVTLTFLLLHLVPGDPVEMMLGESAQAADREALRGQLGLDRPLHRQYLDFLTGVATLDPGQSIHTRQPIGEMVWSRLPATLELTAAALLIAIAMALPLGVVAAVHRGSLWERLAMGFSLLGISIPNFWMGPLLILLFSLGLGWFPVSGREDWTSLVLPALTLGTALAAILSRMVRSTLLDLLGEGFIRTARAKGLSEYRVIYYHGLRNALLPLITLLGLQLGALLGGAVITETIFSWPGIGLLIIESIQRRDYPVVQVCVILVSCSYVLINLITEMLYAWADPRIRRGGGV